MVFEDQLGRKVELSYLPKRIISLVPSQTELLYSLGLSSEVVGITRFCIHPKEWHASKIRVGGTKKVDLEKVKKLDPDLIIANKEENTKSDIEALEMIAPVWISDVNTLQDAKYMISEVGRIIGKREESVQLVEHINLAFDSLTKADRSVLYFIWQDPFYVAGKKTFIDAMLSEAGYMNCCQIDRYPSLEELGSIDPDLIFLSTEPFPFHEQHFDKFQKLFPRSEIHLVDGEMFSWYGSRLKEAPAYFNLLIEKFAN
jgi:ABC-type Fe3+-hydroxamate transport system substrate-binding protein